MLLLVYIILTNFLQQSQSFFHNNSSLHLSYNKLRTVSRDFFVDLKSLTYLYISYLIFTRIFTCTVQVLLCNLVLILTDSLPFLQEWFHILRTLCSYISDITLFLFLFKGLSLNYNSITSLSSEVLSSLNGLISFFFLLISFIFFFFNPLSQSLNNNTISTIPSGGFSGLNNLVTVNANLFLFTFL